MKITLFLLLLPLVSFAKTPCNDSKSIYKVCANQKSIYEKAVQQAKKQKILLVFGAEWCPWCRLPRWRTGPRPASSRPAWPGPTCGRPQ